MCSVNFYLLCSASGEFFHLRGHWLPPNHHPTFEGPHLIKRPPHLGGTTFDAPSTHIWGNPARRALPVWDSPQILLGISQDFPRGEPALLLFGELMTSVRGYSSYRIQSPRENQPDALARKGEGFPLLPFRGESLPPAPFSFRPFNSLTPSTPQITEGLWPGRLSSVV